MVNVLMVYYLTLLAMRKTLYDFIAFNYYVNVIIGNTLCT